MSDLRLSSSESPIAAAAAALDGCNPVLDNKLLAVERERPDGAPLDDRDDDLLLLSFDPCLDEDEGDIPDPSPPSPFINPL